MKAKQGRQPDRFAGDGVTITVRIQPRASRNDVSRMEDGSLKIRLTAPPVEGAANEALVKFLAELLGVARSHVEILSGHTSRQKILRISGIHPAEADRLLKEKEK